MSSEKLSSSVLNKIKKEQLRPRPRWVFILRNSMFWIIFTASVVLGARAIGVVIHTFFEVDFGMIAIAHGSMIRPFLKVLPLFWIIFFLLFLILAITGLHHTKKGYKLPVLKLVGINLILSIILGAGSYAIGDPERFEESLRKQAPFIKTLEQRRQNAWSNPEDGRLAGIIIAIEDDAILLLDDFSKKRWTVDFTDSEQWSPFDLNPRQQVRIVGELTGSNSFSADVIGPWKKPRAPQQRRINGEKRR